MSTAVRSAEPTHARAGDSWQWVRDLPDYPSPGWTLSYTLFGPAGLVRLTAAAYGLWHRVALLPSQTGAYPPGRYDWVAHVTDGTERHQVAAGALEILPDLRTATAADGRSHARRMLDAIESYLEARASDGDLALMRTTLGDQVAEWKPELIAALHQRYAARVAVEDGADLAARGGRPGQVQVVFK